MTSIKSLRQGQVVVLRSGKPVTVLGAPFAGVNPLFWCFSSTTGLITLNHTAMLKVLP